MKIPLRDNGKLMMAVVAAMTLALGLLGWAIIGDRVMVLLLAMILGVVSVHYVVTRRKFDELSVQMANGFQQQEALFSVFTSLPLRAPLPAMGGWAASPDFVRAQIGLLLEAKPETVVELGSGVSTLVSGYTLQRIGSGRVISLDHDEAFSQRTRQNLALHELKNIAQVHHAPITDHTLKGANWRWYDASALDGIAEIDMLVIDGPPETIQRLARYPALPVLYDRLRAGAYILLDDGGRSEEQETVRRWLAEYPGLERLPLYTEKGAILLRKTAG